MIRYNALELISARYQNRIAIFHHFFVIEIRLFRLSFAVCKFSGMHETAGVMVKRSKANIDYPLLLIDQLPKTWYAF